MRSRNTNINTRSALVSIGFCKCLTLYLTLRDGLTVGRTSSTILNVTQRHADIHTKLIRSWNMEIASQHLQLAREQLTPVSTLLIWHCQECKTDFTPFV